MMTKWLRFTVALTAVMLFAACNNRTAPITAPEAEISSEGLLTLSRLQQELQLTPEQIQTAKELAAQYGLDESLQKAGQTDDPRPRFRFMRELSQHLSAEQRQKLRELVGQTRQGKFSGRRGRWMAELGLTDAQKEQLRAAVREFREQRQALIEDGRVDDPALREKLKELRRQHRERMQAILTEEQRQKLQAQREQRRQRFAEARALRTERVASRMAEELGLTAEQQSQIQAILENAGEKMQETRSALRESGAGKEAAREQIRQLREETRAAIEAVLTPEQLENWQQRPQHNRPRRPRGF